MAATDKAKADSGRGSGGSGNTTDFRFTLSNTGAAAALARERSLTRGTSGAAVSPPIHSVEGAHFRHFSAAGKPFWFPLLQ